MARARNIKPSFFRNPDLADCSPHARLLFIGLWTMADREGRLEDRPRYIKFELMPSDTFDVDKELDALAERGFIIRYAIKDSRYIQVVNFKKHQNPHVKEAPSTIPAPDEHGAGTVQDGEGGVQAGLNPESPFPITESPTPPNPLPGEPPDGGDGEKPKKPQEKYPEAFETFWQSYPKGHGNKARSYEQWKRIKPDAALLAEILAGLDCWKQSERWENGYIKAAEIWLRDAWWRDEPPPRKVTPFKGRQSTSEVLDEFRAWADGLEDDTVIETTGKVVNR